MVVIENGMSGGIVEDDILDVFIFLIQVPVQHQRR